MEVSANGVRNQPFTNSLPLVAPSTTRVASFVPRVARSLLALSLRLCVMVQEVRQAPSSTFPGERRLDGFPFRLSAMQEGEANSYDCA